MGTPIQTLPISAAALREVDLVGVFRYADTYPTGVSLVSKKNDPLYPDFSKLITHRFRGLESADKAFEMAARTKDDEGNLVIKVVIETGGEEETGKANL
jgi:L-iditol 2-dehydrogenase